jgi:hypothetical protein
MRPRRHTLQVNTFPFLAVLLCAMGSLILLMLVIDRRARVVACAKALRAAEAALADDRNRQSEWEERRRMLHRQLADENEAMAGKIRGVRGQIEGTIHALEIERQTSQSLRDEIEAVKQGLVQQSTILSAHKADTARARDKDQASQSELARLTDELMKMERTLSDVKEFRKRRQQAYSLVPYQGKKGDNRRPVYIECTATGIVFHPGAVPFRGSRFNRTDVRAEIERRAGRDAISLSSATEPAVTNAYLLVLIRPEGITTYYRTLAMVQGVNIDFGYEFVDRDWVLDFGDAAASKRLWMQQAAIPYVPRNSAAARKVDGIRPFPAPAWQTTVQNDKTTGPGPSGLVASGNSRTTNETGRAADGITQQGGTTPQGPATVISQLPVTLGAARSNSTTSIRMSPSGEQPRRSSDIGFGGQRDAGLATQHVTAPVGANLDRQPDRFGTPGKQGSLSGALQRGDPPLVDPSAHAERFPGQVSPADQAASASAVPSPSIGGPPGLGPPTGATPGGSQQAAMPSTGKPNGAQPVDNSGGESSPRLPADPLSRLAPGDSTRRSQRPLPFSGLLNSNRDWIITVECLADAVVLSPSRQRITIARLVDTNNTNPLYQAVETMIARRQESLRPGELPYRPMIRFRVHPEGARTYYSAYPVLEPLGVPMSRENIELESKHD